MCAGPDALVSSNEAAAAAQPSRAGAFRPRRALRGPRGPRPPAARERAGIRSRTRATPTRARARARRGGSDPSRVAEPPPRRAPDRDRAASRAPPPPSPRGGRFPRTRRGVRGARAGFAPSARAASPPRFKRRRIFPPRGDVVARRRRVRETVRGGGKKRPRPFSTAGDFFDDALCERFGTRRAPRVRRPGSRVGRYPYKPETLDPPPVARRVGGSHDGGTFDERESADESPSRRPPPRPRRRLRAARARRFASRVIEFGDVLAREDLATRLCTTR